MVMSPTKTKKVANLEADIVILGSGGGLVAAAAAVERGVTNIIVLEKQGELGGHSKMAQGLGACESPLQKREEIIADRDDCFKASMKFAHWAYVDPRVVRAYINKSGDTIRWFQEKGVHFDLKVRYLNQKFGSFHRPLKGKGPEYGRGAELIKVLTRECKEAGVKLLLRTRGKRIIRDAKGRVTGVVAAKGRKEFEIKARCVIIATGGFAGNRELLKKYCPDYSEGMHIREMSEHHTGDGLLMAAEAGAAISEHVSVYLEAPHPNYSDRGESLAASMKEPISGAIKEPNTVWVNKKGRRFVDEAAGLVIFETGNAAAMQPDRMVYTLFDDQIRQDWEAKGFITGRGWGKEERGQRVAVPGLQEVLQRRASEGEGSLVKVADSWEEIARWIGADPRVLKAEIKEYNSYCDHGYDAIFIKERRFLQPLRTPPYYAIRGITSLGGTTGGIKVNERMEVLDTKYDVIPGLYAAGVIADGWQGQTPCGEGAGGPLTFAMNSGRIAGESAAEYVLRK
jgi:fumarate reductase flavoprotein subunit